MKNLLYGPLESGESFFGGQFDKHYRIYIKVSLQVLKKAPLLTKNFPKKDFLLKNSGADRKPEYISINNRDNIPI